MDDQYQVPFGVWLRQQRKKLDLTRGQLAERVGCSVETIRRVEEGLRRPSRQMAELIAGALEVSPEERATLVKWARTEHPHVQAAAPSNLTATSKHTPNNMVRADAPDLAPSVVSAARPCPKEAGRNPYKGIRSFYEADAPDFFGREAFIERLVQRLGERGEFARFLAVVGPSGSGKSSLARAGLVPALRGGALPNSEGWLLSEMVPGPHPLEELEAALLRIAVNAPSSLLEQLQSDERGLARAVKRVLPADPRCELFLLIDQFEEVFTLVADEAARKHLLDSLYTAVSDERSRLRVVVTLRADFYDRPLLHPGVGALLRTRTEVLLPLSAAELERAIAQPAAQVAVSLEPELIATIVRDVGEQPGALPLLQYSLTELFEHREGNVLTLTGYREYGGLRGALERRAEALYLGLRPVEQDEARQLMLRLVTLGEGIEDTRRRVRRAELASAARDEEALDRVLEVFGEHRLLTFDRDPVTGGPSVEVAHEALLRVWGRLRAWLDESRSDLRTQRILQAAASEWVARGRDEGFLAAGGRLTQFEGLLSAMLEGSPGAVTLTEDEAEYVRASMAARAQREELERTRQAHELELAREAATAAEQAALVQRRAARRLRVFVAALALFLLVSLALALFAVDRQAVAEANFTRSHAQRLAAEANALLGTGGNTQLASLLSIRSLNTQYTPEGDTALLTAATLHFPRMRLKGHNPGVRAVAFSPDGRYGLSGGGDKTARLWDLQTGQEVRNFTGHDDGLTDVAFSPNGKYVLTAAHDWTARLWDMATGAELRRFKGHEADVFTGVFSPDGNYVLTASPDGSARLWDVETAQEVRAFRVPTGALWGAVFSPDGKYLATGGDDMLARLWDAQTGQEIRQFKGHTFVVNGVAFSPDGKYLATCSDDKTARLWDVQTGEMVRSFVNPAHGIGKVIFSPDGTRLLTGGYDNADRLWDVENGTELLRFSVSNQSIAWVAFSPDGKQVLTAGGFDSSVWLWDVEAQSLTPTFRGHIGTVNEMTFSPDGRYAVTGGDDFTVRLWDVKTGREVRRFPGHTGWVGNVAYSRDGKYILTGSFDKTVRLWDPHTGQELRRFLGSDTTTYVVHDVGFSPDGRYVIAAAGADNNARLWDLQTGELLHLFEGHTGQVWGATFSPDGRYIATSESDGMVILWDAATWKQVHVLKGEFSGVESVDFSPDGTYVLISGADGSLRLWSTETGLEVRRFLGHVGQLFDATFSPDGRWILSGGEETAARLWEVKTGREVRRLAGHTQFIASVAFTPDGKYAAASSADWTGGLWQLDYHEVVDYLCGRLLRDFTDQERAQYNIEDKAPTCPGR